MTDIKKIRNMIVEAQDEPQAKAEQWIVNEMKRILSDPEDDGSNIYNVYEYLEYAVYEHVKNASDAVVKLYQTLAKPTNAKALFTKAVGQTPAAFCDKAHKELDKQAAIGLDPLSKKIWRILGDKMTTTLNPRAAKFMAWHKVSPKKICVLFPDNLGLPAAYIAAPTLDSLKMSMEDMIKWLTQAGIRQTKKPKVHKSPPPYYD